MIPADHLTPPGQPDDIYRRLADMERELRELRAERKAERTTISGGTLKVVDTDGGLLAALGDLGSGYRGTVINRAGGSTAFAIYGTGSGSLSGFVGLYDRSGNYIVTDDAASSRGLARPYIPLQ